VSEWVWVIQQSECSSVGQVDGEGQGLAEHQMVQATCCVLLCLVGLEFTLGSCCCCCIYMHSSALDTCSASVSVL
jgi:hypothetical protein